MSTVAGTGTPGYSGDGGLATSATLTGPTGIAVDSGDNLYICDRDNGVVRRVTSSGLITTIAGTFGVPRPATGDGALASKAQLDPWRVAVDASGYVYVSDLSNDRIRKLTPKIVTAASIQATGGNNQTGTPSGSLKSPLTVTVLDATGAGVPGVVVNFSVNPADIVTLQPATAITLNDGTASTTVILGVTAGTATITATAQGVTGTATFTLTITAPVSSTAPVISNNGVVSAGLSVPAVNALSPNAIVSIFGSNFAPLGTAKQVSAGDLVNGALPTSFAGVCVQVGGQPAPILAVFPTQINMQVPAASLGNSTVEVTTGCGTASSQTSNAAAVTIQSAAPEFFYFLNNANGHNPIAAINAVTHAYIGSPGLISSVTFVPAKSGDILTLFATGFGATNPSFAAGQLPTTAGVVTASVTVSIGGITVDAADILYAGVVGGDAGLYQLNVQIPAGVPTGDEPVIVTIGGVASPSNAYITVSQ